MNIFFIIPSMAHRGGAEKSIAKIANYFAEKGNRVSIVTLDAENLSPAFKISPKIELIPLNLLLPNRSVFKLILNVIKRVKSIRGLITKRKPDIVVSFMDTMNITTLLSTKGLRVPTVVCERVAPQYGVTNTFVRFLRSWTYQWAALVLTQTKRMKDYFSKNLQKKIMIIPNAVPQFKGTPLSREEGGCYRIVNVARLALQKRLDLLIKAFSLLHTKYPDWEVIVYGEGDQRKKLENLRDQLGLREKVFFPGVTENVEEVLSKAHIMAFPSRFEGFPNALAEGISLGLPAVGFKEVSGVEDLIADGKNGFLVDSTQEEEGLAKALEALMSNPDLRKKFSDFGREHVKQWEESHIYALWEKTLLDVVKRNVTTNS